VITSVAEQFWTFDVTYSIEAFQGSGAEAGSTLELLTRTARHEIMTAGHQLRANAPKVQAQNARAPTHTHAHAAHTCSWELSPVQIDKNAPPGAPPRPP
jgi:hypothetical protein